MKAWNVYLDGELIDMVFHVSNSAAEVKKGLIDHDSYDPNIEVEKKLLTRGKRDEKEKI